MKNKSRPVFLILVIALGLAVLWAPAPLQAASERILDFKSHLVIHPDASLTVTEDITVRSAKQEIKRGIVREFPTTYKDRLGNTVKVDFEVEEVLLNGRREPYHIKPAANGVKVYIGQKDVFLEPGVYTYTIKYRTNRQLGYFQDFDELYWNVTGHGWTFRIDRAAAIIELPPGAKVLRHAAYTGPQGARGQDFRVHYDDRGHLVFTTSRALAPGQGLTIAVSWPKGVVSAPTEPEKLGFLLKDNLSIAAALAGLVVVFAYYLVIWFWVGRDPAPGTIIPLFMPPQGFSPAAVRFVRRMDFDQKAVAAIMVDMAVKGYLNIKENDGDFILQRTGAAPSALTQDETGMAAKLFALSPTVDMKSENHAVIQGAREALKASLKKAFEKSYFFTHTGYLAPGIVITLLSAGAIIFTSPDKFQAAFSSLWLLIWTVACGALGVQVYRRWQAARGHSGIGKVFSALGVTLFALPFFAGEIFGLWFFASTISLVAMSLLGVMVFLTPLFYYLLKAPTLTGRKIMDQIEGFRLYLSVAEQERLNLLNPPEKTPQLFEKYLPYALALDVENEWCEQFAGVLAQAGVGGQAYSPTWYSGSSWDPTRSSGFASCLGDSFAGAIASSSTPPGSTSGSNGGGSSGGGGGGGGGSGW